MYFKLFLLQGIHQSKILRVIYQSVKWLLKKRSLHFIRMRKCLRKTCEGVMTWGCLLIFWPRNWVQGNENSKRSSAAMKGWQNGALLYLTVVAMRSPGRCRSLSLSPSISFTLVSFSLTQEALDETTTRESLINLPHVPSYKSIMCFSLSHTSNVQRLKAIL